MIPAVWYFLFKNQAGLVVRAVGESPFFSKRFGILGSDDSMRDAGFQRSLYRAFRRLLSLIYTPLWVEGMIAGRGWIALALVTFGTWRPFRSVLRRVLVRRHDHAADESSSIGISVPTQFISMAPYAATIIVWR